MTLVREYSGLSIHERPRWSPSVNLTFVSNTGIAAGLECMTVDSIDRIRKINPKVRSNSIYSRIFFTRRMVSSTEYMSLTGRRLCTSPRLSSSYGCYF